MSEITIVTAFFDIGRGSWSPSQGLPAYLQRTNDTYFERFANMASLENEMVVFTSEDLVERVNQIRGDKKTHINVVDFSYEGEHDAVTDAFRDFVRRYGIRVYAPHGYNFNLIRK